MSSTAALGRAARNTEAGAGLSLSVVLPNYNHAAHLPAALDALLAQTRPADEIIVVEDGSTDDSAAVIRRYAGAHPRLFVIENGRNMGAIASLNRGLSVATGTHVYCAAADDTVCSHLLSSLIAPLARFPDAALACGEMRLVGEDGRGAGTRPIARPTSEVSFLTAAEARALLVASDHWIWTGAALFRRRLAVECGGFDPRLGSMADGFFLRRIALAHGFCFVPQVVATSNVNEDGLSRTTARDPAQINAMLGVALERIASDPVFPPGYAQIFARRLKFAVARLALLREPVAEDMLTQVAARSSVDAALYRAAAKAGAPGRALALIWLTLRLRPASMLRILSTALQRRFSG